MGTKAGQKGRYICKVGYLDVYAKDAHKPKKASRYKFTIADVKSTLYQILHGKKVVKGDLKTKDDAVNEAITLMGDKAKIYGL
jgi:hypothetical protein